jgi:adenylate kinase
VIQHPVNIVLLGAPGAGKGTQAENIARLYGVPHISTGEIFRGNIKAGTPLGDTAKTYIEAGQLVPDDVTIAMVDGRLSEGDAANGFVLDGFPRTLAQASVLDERLAKAGQAITVALNIRVEDDAIVRRLAGRRMCKSCAKPYHVYYNPPAVEGVCDKCGGEIIQRVDDEESTVLERLAVYHAQTAPLIGYYRERGVFAESIGHERLEDTTAEALETLAKALAKALAAGGAGSTCCAGDP